MYGGARADGSSADSNTGAKPIDISALPTDLDGEIHRAQALRAQGKLDDAAHALGQIMLVAPDDSRVVGEYGKVLVLENRPQDAEEFLRRAIQLQASDWTFYSALGVAYDEQGDNKSAKAAYQRALVLKPGEPAILNNYALSRMAAGDLVSARQIIAQAQAAGGNDPTIAHNVSLVMESSRQPAVAVVAKPVAAAKVAPAAVAAAAPSKVSAKSQVATAPLAAPNGANVAVATSAPRVLNKDVVMQDVPVDPLAGPVGKHAKHQKKSATPSLRMSADAS